MTTEHAKTTKKRKMTPEYIMPYLIPRFNTNLYDQNNNNNNKNKDERILNLNVRLFLVLFLPYGIDSYCFFSYLYHNQDGCLWFFPLSINRCLSLYMSDCLTSYIYQITPEAQVIYNARIMDIDLCSILSIRIHTCGNNNDNYYSNQKQK